MDNKLNQEKSLQLQDQDLTFTMEDRIKTFHKIQENNQKKQRNAKSSFYRLKRFTGPALGSILTLVLFFVLLVPSLHLGNEEREDSKNKILSNQQEPISYSVLLMGKDSADYSNRRSSLNILMTYNGKRNSIKLVPIPRDTYVTILDSKGKIASKDKLMHASALNTNPEAVLNTVSNLFHNIPIDYYATIPEEELYNELGISKSDARENRYTIDAVAELIKGQLTYSEIRDLLSSAETNIPSEILNNNVKLKSESIEVINLNNGLKETYIDGIYFVRLDPKVLEATSISLKQHLNLN
ncbi:LCP family protein [Ornithinibacillus sp. 179-J 7C1 HS]|uniref:LCP family glycopolymer transferase n=1 Tax=Ornithinibacillus sp. 179-J 7C1 HS TaxID=3142384 RepID=UPI0039A2FAA1